MRRLLSLALAALVLTGCSGSDSSDVVPDPKVTIEGVKSYPGQKNTHLTEASQYPVAYDPVPPVGGPHSKAWLRCDVYSEPVPNENAVHSLEHGAVWVTYQPGLPAADVAKLAQLQGVNTNYVLVSPFEGLTNKVVASAWSLQLALDSVDDPRLLEFVRTYAGNGLGNEKGADCRSVGLTPDKARQFDAQAKQ